MNKTYIDVLNELAELSSTNDKIKLLEHHKNVEYLSTFLKYMIDIRIKFNVVDIPLIQPSSVQELNDKEAFILFLSLSEKLISKEYTGFAALEQIVALFKQLSVKQLYWFTLCLQKDSARLGIGRKVVNKVWPKLVLDFKVSLAECEDEIDKFEFGDKACVELKLNGVRTIVVVRNGIVEDIYGRSGLPIENFKFLVQYIESINFTGSYVLDGEVHMNNSLENTMSLFGFDLTKTEQDFIGKNGKVGSGWKKYLERRAEVLILQQQARYAVFDYLDIHEWDNTKCITGYQARRDKLKGLFSIIPTTYPFEMPPYYEVKDYDEALSHIKPWIEQGLEGGILKVYDHLYSFKRDRNWIKIKEEDSTTVQIVEIIESKTKFNSDGSSKDRMMGAFKVKAIHPYTKEVIYFEIGTGKLFSEDFRIDVMNNPDNYLTKFMDMTCQRFTDTSAICPRAEAMRFDRNDFSE
jgi:hypothetical protein